VIRSTLAKRLLILASVAAMLSPLALAAGPLDQAVQHDAVLRAMKAELERSKTALKLDKTDLPYYVEYSVTDLDQYTAQATFGAIRMDQRARARLVRAVVRLGDYKQDSYFRHGEGSVDLLPVDDNAEALRHVLWLVTDRAYKQAASALTQKQAVLKQFESEQQSADDFSRERAEQYLSDPAQLTIDLAPWREMLRTVSGMYRSDPQLESWEASAVFKVQTQYFVNSEGSAIRRSQPLYMFAFEGSTQAKDGMDLERSHAYVVADAKELPTAEQVRKDATEMLATLKELRDAAVVEDDYRGPVLFAADAANDLINDIVGRNIAGSKPQPGVPVRTTGEYASSYKSRVLPDFLNIVDDPTTTTFAGQSLIGAYRYDEEGVAARPVNVVQKGMLVNYLVGREPIRDFATSNGHGRAAPGMPPQPHIGNLFVRPTESHSFVELKKKLIDMCKEQGREYGYLVATLGPNLTPRLLYRVYAKDGHEQLVRGGDFNQLDTRALRSDLIAAGNDPEVSNRPEPVPTTIVSPSLLFGELEIQRSENTKDKLPDYPPPPLS
jgi:TldD protein